MAPSVMPAGCERESREQRHDAEGEAGDELILSQRPFPMKAGISQRCHPPLKLMDDASLEAQAPKQTGCHEI
jgi:hypothetical protein